MQIKRLILFNIFILTKGHTGSGKTYTLMGKDDEVGMGIIPRAAATLFGKGLVRRSGFSYFVSVSVIEVSCGDKITDFLTGMEVNLKFNKTNNKVSYFAEGAKKQSVKDVAEVFKTLKKSFETRKTRETAFNLSSSRSHAIVSISKVYKFISLFFNRTLAENEVLRKQSEKDMEEIKVLKELLSDAHQKINQMSNSIATVVCIRSIQQNEKYLESTIFEVSGETLTIRGPGGDTSENIISRQNFNQIFLSSSTQEDVFKEIKYLVQSALDGHPVTI